VERDKLTTAVWAIAGLIALAPAMGFICLGILLSLTLLPTLPKALANLDGYTLPFIARTVSEVIGGCAGLIAAWLGILIPQELQIRPNLKRIFLVFGCAGVAAMWGYIPEEGWRHLTLGRLWIMLGPVIVGLSGLYRVFCGKSPIAVEGQSS
jgi:hypothetical protein